jgi:hypothetical protein
MKLRFIGTNGSMGLKHGKIYNVEIDASFGGKWIWVYWNDFIISRACQYSSLKKFAENWEDVK